MRIISKFHDYYDVGQRYDLDRDLIYLRHQKDIPGKSSRYRQDWKLLTLGFCGKAYPLFRYRSGIYYDIEGVEAIISKRFPNLFDYWKRGNIKDYNAIRRSDTRNDFWHIPSRIDILKDFASTNTHLFPLFQEHKTPIWLKSIWGGDGSLIINPSLRDIDWHTRMDPITCYQEISMYLGGVLGADNKPIPHVSNEDLIAAKGFDKFSFRKEKS